MLEEKSEDEIMNKLKEMLKTVRFGSITLIVQDGRVIQLEKHEKVRFR
ncbi:DUF2292 domain-containing protein [Falsibacillus albus]|uniref:DUF2292 domain-containing protein n=1 Tax=Falsibacillus albus TaxID=2478915 RepID=A0A3L7JZD9_9BACI|nr:YezD family protein [Falsibacillus albus]RLQ95890.1 DUF2292 domain-containing protein [Falsibacillus albus]